MPIDLSTIAAATGVPDDQEQQTLDTRVRELSAAFAGSTASVHEALVAAERKFSEEAAETFAAPTAGPEVEVMTSAQRSTLRDAAERTVRHKLDEYRANLIQETSHNRGEMLRLLEEAHTRLELAVKVAPSATAMLGMTALGDERRQRYEAQLYGAGPATLGNAAVLAVATGDVVLGAAVLSRLDAMPRDQRPVQPQELADKLLGRRHGDLVQRTERARLALSAARDAERLLRLGKADGFSKIGRGLAARKLAGTAAA